MIDILKYFELEALGKAEIITVDSNTVEIFAKYVDSLGNPKPESLGIVTRDELYGEAGRYDDIAAKLRQFAQQAFNDQHPVKGMTRLEFLWGRFYQNEIIGAYGLSRTNDAVLAFLKAIEISTPDDFNRYVILTHPLVQAGVPLVMNLLEQSGVIAAGTAATRIAEVLDPNWVKP